MRLRHVLSVFALAMLPALSIGTGCGGEAAPSSDSANVTELTGYTIDAEAMNATFSNRYTPIEAKITKLADPWTALVKVGEKTIPAPTHLFGDVINVIPYANEDGLSDASGEVFERADEVIARYYKPGFVGIAIKMHRPANRVVDLNTADAARMKEDFKLQDTHIEVVVGVEKAEHGQPGAVTLNNPQDYELGRFGKPNYPMIFIEPTFPDYARGHEQKYMDNIRTALVGFNAVSDFPGSYNGGDPLGANTPEQVRRYTAMMVLAASGDEDAQKWFKDPANLVYCAELAYLTFSSGLIVPLNETTMVPLLGEISDEPERVWKRFKKQVDRHNSAVDSFLKSGEIDEEASIFIKLNKNKRVAMVRMTLAPEDLRPMATLPGAPAAARSQMVLKALTMADIVGEFMRTHLPRQILGEGLAEAQGKVLAGMKEGLYEAMGFENLPENDPARVKVGEVFDEMVAVVSKSYADYDAFRAALEAPMTAAQQLTGPRPGDTSGTGLYSPPSLFHVAAQGQHHGLLGFQYVGHGVHISHTVKSGSVPPQPVAVDALPASGSCAQPVAGSDGPNACGGIAPSGACRCDAECITDGGCCDDAASVCGY